MKKILIVASLLLCMAFSAHAQSSSLITEAQAIELAKQEIVKRGGNLDEVGKVYVSFNDGNGFWIVRMFGKPTAEGLYLIGNDATVLVSPDGANIKIIPGH